MPPVQPSQYSESHGETTYIDDLRDTSEPSSCGAENEIDDVDMNAASDGSQVPLPPAPTSMGEETQTNAAVDTPANLDVTLYINELEHYVTQEGEMDSEGEGAMSDRDEVPIPAALAATFEQEMTPGTKHHENQVHSALQVSARDVNSLHTAQEARHAADLHARTMMQSRARKSPVNASPAVATAATTESTIRRRENSRVIKQWTKVHLSSVPDIALVDEQGNGVDKAVGKWIAEGAQELVELVKKVTLLRLGLYSPIQR